MGLIYKIIMLCMSLVVIPNGSHWFSSVTTIDVDKVKCTYDQTFDFSIYSTLPYKESQIIALCRLNDRSFSVKCIDIKENTLNWEKKYSLPGYTSNPKISGKYLYLPLKSLRCIDLDNGNEILNVTIGDLQSKIESVDYIDEDHVIVSGLGFIASINLLHQKQDWLFTYYDKSLDCVPESGYGDCYSSVMPQKDFIWCLGRCQLYKIDYNGKILEQHQLEEWMYHACIDKSGKYIYAVSDTTLYCIDLSTFKTVWKFKNGYNQWVEKSVIIYDALSIAYDDSRIYCTFDYYHQYDGIICFDAKTGKEIWRKDDFDQQPIGYNNLLFLSNSVKDSDKMSIKFYILDNVSGKELKSFGPFEGIDKQSINVDFNRVFLSHSYLIDWRNNTYQAYIKCFSLR